MQPDLFAPPVHKPGTQCALILEFMRANGSITPADAIDAWRCYRLAARIYDLRKRYAIKTDKSAGYARYSLEAS